MGRNHGTEHGEAARPKNLKNRIENLGKDRRAALNRPGISEDDAKHISGVIGERIRGIELQHHDKARMTVCVKDRLEGNAPTAHTMYRPASLYNQLSADGEYRERAPQWNAGGGQALGSGPPQPHH